MFVIQMPNEHNGYKPKLCAAYYGRPDKLEEADWICYMLAVYYNCIGTTNVEVNRGETVSNFKKWGAIMDGRQLAKIIDEELFKRGMTQKEFCEAIGIQSSAMSAWRKGSMPRPERIAQIEAKQAEKLDGVISIKTI